jgi:hypothetical protein
MFTLFVPGLEAAGAGLPRMPALERLLARGRLRPLDGSPWALLARLAGGDLRRWPVGPVSTLAELPAAPASCLRVEPLGADALERGVFRIPASSLGLEPFEGEALAAAFNQAFGADGLQLVVAVPERWYLAWTPGERDWRGFEGPVAPLGGRERPAPPEPALRRLLSEAEMLFHGQGVNAARRERAAPQVVGLHPWGGGTLAEGPAVLGPAEPGRSEPYLAGLSRLGALVAAELEMVHAAADARPGGVAWPAAIESVDVAGLASLEEDWAAPLLRALSRGRLAGVRIVTGRAVHEIRRLDTLRAWRRPRPLAELC